MAKDRYEISLWEDYLVEAQNDIPAHYEEKKIAVIGSDSMTAECRAIEPKLVENINGTNTFTFKMFYVYTDRYGKKYQNPFLNLLVNERKVKVLWKNKWYDLIIKNCQEDSSGKSITYTCKDLFINELSKTGFELVLDNELGNNQGTAIELAKTVLENTDWSVDEVNSENVRQTKEEPVYECTTLIRATSPKNELTNEDVEIPSNKLILVFYQQIQDIINSGAASGTFSYFQFIYDTNGYQTEQNSQLVVNGTPCYRENVKWAHNVSEHLISIGNTSDWIRIYYLGGVSNRYRADRLIKSQKCVLDSLTKKYCYVYKANQNGSGQYANLISQNDEIYEYRSTEYKDPTVVNNLVVNAKDFTTTEGWSGEGITFFLYPPYDSSQDISQYTATSYLRINGQAFNAIKQSSNYIPNGFNIGEKYIFRFKAKNESGADISTAILTPSICDKENTSTVYFNVTNTTTNGSWIEYTMVCIKSITRSEIYSHNVCLMLTVSGNGVIWLGEAQLYPLVYGTKNNESIRINPGEMDINSISTVYYYYFNHTKNDALLNPEDLQYLYKGTEKPTSLLDILNAQYNENFEKIRSISAKQSNRFNILQSIAETFECWIRFVINHDSTGRVIYNEDGTPQKYIVLKPEIGEEVGVGFIYGIDLKTISRTIQSDQIVTKTIVKNNSNEFGTDGFCSIARSIENYPRVNFILNFDYYISHGLLDANEVNKDLYLSSGPIGYYYYLNQYNTEYDSLQEILTQKQTELLKQEGFLTVYEATITSLEQQINDLKSELTALASATSFEGATSYITKNSEAEQIKGRMTAIITLEETLSDYESRKADLESSIQALKALINTNTQRQDTLTENIKAKNLEFYKKYSRYIQEGSWISEDYVDDNLYYLDALSVAYTSSRPQISYNISVLRLSSLEEFKNKVFHLGDISFIQDTEFFGYVTDANGIKSPYKEKVLVSEITSNFDSPEQDSFKVQNYKTQFEDLFQRITSTTQSLQYASGEYGRAAAIVETDGTINGETLQASIALNEQLVYSAQNESILNDSTGITVTDTTNPNKKTKITSGGVFITTDGGTTWKNAVRGEGIATQYLTAGLINVNNINIMDGTFTAFRWDADGINAYYKNYTQDGTEIDLSKFVRFDHYGIYGIKESSSNSFKPSSIDDVFSAADFGLTWDGFFIKNKYDNHYVEISSDNDIQVVATSSSDSSTINRVKIGYLGNDQFGIQLRDENDHVTLQTADNGTLWLEDRLNISSTSDSYNIGIGYLSSTNSSGKHEVINANDSFIVYEDGSMKATNGTFNGSGEFTGTIYATGGSIGNMSIDQIEYSAYEVIIESNNGTIFKNGAGSKLLTAHLYKSGTEVMGTTYSWYSGNTQLSANSSTCVVSANPSQDVYAISCVVTV